MTETQRGASAPAKYYPLLDLVIDRIINARKLPPKLPPTRKMIMDVARHELATQVLTRRMAETHAMRYLFCEKVARHG